jgi:hypothetical protein
VCDYAASKTQAFYVSLHLKARHIYVVACSEKHSCVSRLGLEETLVPVSYFFGRYPSS